MKPSGELKLLQDLLAGEHKLSIVLIVLISCNAILLFFKLNNSIEESSTHEKQFEPIQFIGSRLLVVIMTYLSSLSFTRKHRNIKQWISTVRWTWRGPLITLLYLEIVATAAASLLLLLAIFAKNARGAASEALFMLSLMVLFLWLGPVLFAYSDIACKMSVVVSVAEEDCRGAVALRRAGELIEVRKLRGFGLSIVFLVLEQVPSMVFDHKKVGPWSIEGVGLVVVNVVVKFVVYFLCTAFYFECKERVMERSQEGRAELEW